MEEIESARRREGRGKGEKRIQARKNKNN